MEQAYRQSTRVLGAVLAVVGVAMVATTLVSGGGPLALGVILGAMLAVLGVARVRLASDRHGRSRT